MAVAFRQSFRSVDPFSVKAAQEASSKFASDIAEETRKAIREVVAKAISEGIPPRDAAKLIRSVIGLDARRAGAVVNLHTKLTQQGVSQPELASKTSRYAGRLLKQRAETIARTEIMRAQNAGQRAAWDKAVEDGLISSRSDKRWLVADDDRLCPYCAPLDGVTVPLDGVFRSGLGTVEEPPLHPNCRCTVGLVPTPVARPQRVGTDEGAPTGAVEPAGGRKLAEMAESVERAEKAALEAAQQAAIEAAQKAAAAAAQAAEEAKIAHMKAAQERFEADAAKAAAAAKAEQLAKMEAVRSSGSTKWMDDLLSRQIAPAKGSNPGGVFEDATGRRFYVKQYANEQQALSEQVSNRIYRELGLGGPKKTFAVRDSSGRMNFASEIVENQGTIGSLGLTKARADQILKGFSADVLVANWDAVGTGLDNVVAAGKKVVRIDQGGTLLFRAQGGAKPSSVFTDISEWQTFITKNAYYKQVFQAAGVAPDTLGAKAIAQIDAIEKLRAEVGGWKKFVTKSLGKAAKGNKAFVDETARLLEARTELLLQKRAGLQSIASAPVPTVRTTSGWPIGDDVVRRAGSQYPRVLAQKASPNLGALSREANSAIVDYTGSDYSTWNKALWRNPNAIKDGTLPSRVREMQKALTDATTGMPELVWRGTDVVPGDLAAGRIVALDGFQSATIRPAVAVGWGSQTFEIIPKRGMFVQGISQHGSENEFLLPHGQRYRVVGRKTIRYETRDGSEVRTTTVWQLEML